MRVAMPRRFGAPVCPSSTLAVAAVESVLQKALSVVQASMQADRHLRLDHLPLKQLQGQTLVCALHRRRPAH